MRHAITHIGQDMTQHASWHVGLYVCMTQLGLNKKNKKKETNFWWFKNFPFKGMV